MKVVTHCSRDADATRRTLGLQSSRYIHDVAVDVEAIWNYIPDVDAYAEANGSIGGLVTIVGSIRRL